MRPPRIRRSKSCAAAMERQTNTRMARFIKADPYGNNEAPYNKAMDTTVVILAAGLGTRMKSRRAKVLHQAGGRTLIEHVVHTAREITAPERIYVVVGHQAEQVRETLLPYGVGFVHQAEQKGTGHALMMGREALSGLDGLLLILYGDGPLVRASTLQRLIDTEKNSGAAGT